MTADREALLRKYGRHLDDCRVVLAETRNEKFCDCGLTAALSAPATQAPAAQPETVEQWAARLAADSIACGEIETYGRCPTCKQALCGPLPAAPQEAARDALDAARYRWLRDECELSVRDVFGGFCQQLNDGLDAAIDAARGEPAKDGDD